MERTWRDERQRGATAVEYGLLISLIAGFLVAGVILFGDFVADLFDAVQW